MCGHFGTRIQVCWFCNAWSSLSISTFHSSDLRVEIYEVGLETTIGATRFKICHGCKKPIWFQVIIWWVFGGLSLVVDVESMGLESSLGNGCGVDGGKGVLIDNGDIGWEGFNVVNWVVGMSIKGGRYGEEEEWVWDTAMLG